MSDVSELLLVQRFDADRGWFDFEVEKQDDGSEVHYAAKRFGLLRDDVSTGMDQLPAERILELIAAFKQKSLVADNEAQTKLRVAGRQILYQQLAEAYAFGLACFSSIYNREHLTTVLSQHDLGKQAKALTSTGSYNKWNAITALLYGRWVNTDTDAPIADGEHEGIANRAYRRDRSAEKYGCVLATLEGSKVRVPDVVDFITTAKFKSSEDGKVYGGILALEMHYRQWAAKQAAKRAKKPTPRQIARRQQDRANAVAKAENPANDDVFEFAKPAQLSEAVEFGRIIFKVLGDKLFVVGVDGWEQAKYDEFVIAKGRKILAREAEIQAGIDAKREGVKESAGAVLVNLRYDEDFSDLLADGADVEEVTAAFKATVADMKAKRLQKQTEHLEQFADPIPD
ncbi:hypothetical protein Sj15T_32510 [Sphingobium sp. TA15]|uniref:hypothetical protein n=1 Tax=Sphingobium sp. TA15 TaxID=2905832 RepID=UPI0030864049|nr:hypothetical protein Sj15T_32510 [Sphingobium sp. TA15]